MKYTAKKTKVKPTNTVKCNNCFKEICQCDNCDEYFIEEQNIICMEKDNISYLHFCNDNCYKEYNRKMEEAVVCSVCGRQITNCSNCGKRFTIEDDGKYIYCSRCDIKHYCSEDCIDLYDIGYIRKRHKKDEYEKWII